jgi:hypothetical protein
MMPRRYEIAIQLFQPANDSAFFVIHPRTRAELACYDSSTPPFFSMVYLSLQGDCPLVEFDERRKKVRVRLSD